MKILLFGKNGQVGWELQRSLAPLGQVLALNRHSQDYCGDLSKLTGIVAAIADFKPDIVVNAAAYTAVDKAETEAEQAQLINAAAPAAIAEAARACDAWLVHYSTDYVFDGTGERPWQEDDPTSPASIYGSSKLAGERAILASGVRHLIFRTSWVYATRGQNFAKTMLRLARERDRLSVIDDQIGAPTGAELIADVTAHAIRSLACKPDVSGIYHLAAAGQTSWHGYARLVFDLARQHGETLLLAPSQLKAIPTSDYPTPARRPLNSRLNTEKLRTTFGLNLPDWQAGIDRMLTEHSGH